MRYFREIIIAVSLLLSPQIADSKSKSRSHSKSVVKKSKAKKKHKVRKKRPSWHDKLVNLKRSYRRGEINDRKMWIGLSKLHDHGDKFSKSDRIALLQSQAHMLYEGKYPILAAIYASQAIKISEKPTHKHLRRSWSILRQVSQKQPIQNLLEVLAAKIKIRGPRAPEFGTDWNYFAGNSLVRKNHPKKALKAYGKLKISDRYFFPAKYQQAMIHVNKGNLDEAKVALKPLIYPLSQRMSPLSLSVREEMTDHARMALGRIFYEQREFMNAIRMYRTVNKESIQYYDSLFEQGWAFFMGGYPNHSLGALHAVDSPFYTQVFNPESKVLRSLVYYWLCRYEDSRNSLADFMENNADAITSLGDFLDRKRLGPESAYRLFENLVSGVSSASLGVPRSILQTASEKDSMALVRSQYAAITTEMQRLESRGVFRTKKGLRKPTDYLNRWGASLRKDIGKRFLAELKYMKKDYDRLYSQAQFLYIELLMSEKEQLLGKELHASTKITKVNRKMAVRGWGDKMQSWKGSDKNEYWWDEVGFYIYRLDSKCND